MILRTIILILFIAFFSSNYLTAKTLYPAIKTCNEYTKTITNEKSESKKLSKALDFIWGQWMKEYPTWASFVGYPGYDALWPDNSLETIANRKSLPDCHLILLNKINSSKLSAVEKITHKLILKKINSQIKEKEFPSEYLAIDQLGGVHLELADVMDSTAKAKLEDFENRIKRLEKYDILVDQIISLLEEGIKNKVTPVKFLLEKVPAQIQSVIFKNPKDSPIYKVMQEMPEHIPAEQKTKLLAQTEELINSKVNPSLTKLKKFVEEKYLPQCRTDISIQTLPNGEKWYAYLIENHTTTKKTAQEIHDIGLKEVAKINNEMTAIRNKLKFKGSKKEFHNFLQTDEKFYFTNPKDLIQAYRTIGKEIDPELTKLFSDLPRLPYGVKAMADYKAASAPTAYYQPGSLKNGRPGFFEANTYNLKSRAKWEMEVLTAHEAVPGHHLQISIAQELGDMPEFRKHEGYTAFVEGWGLYSESLGDELGLYKDLYNKYGQLTYEMWRAVRLVVDTGMHSLGWSKDKALNYFMDNVPKDKLQSEVEIDRYITWPGQALAYKIGELKFKELKEKAKQKLGAKFDVREFHKIVLQQGAVPLDVLEDEFNQWLKTKKM
jgi:uncharacterized protein (DUF885 family)